MSILDSYELDDDEEEWRPVVGHPDYVVSNFGRVFSLRSQKYLTGHIKKYTANRRSGRYVEVHIRDFTGSHQYLLHRLVAQAFLPPDGPVVNHDDGDKEYNVIDNLEWTTHQKNIQHAYNTGLKVSHGRSHRPIKIVETGEEFESLRACARYLRGHHRGITECLIGKIAQYKGYTFTYL